MTALLQEIFLPAFEGSYDTSFSNKALELHEATMPRLASTIIQPVTTPGLHFHHVPRGHYRRHHNGRTQAPRGPKGGLEPGVGTA